MKIAVLRVKEIAMSVLPVLLLMGFAAFTGDMVRFDYDMLQRPDFAPAAPVFSLVWSILYILLIIASYIVFTSEEYTQSNAIIYYITIFLNFVWYYVFFIQGNREGALLVLIALILVSIVMLYSFLSVNIKAGILTLPYIVWIFFALILSISINKLN